VLLLRYCEYLLSETHAVGKAKAKLFHTLGFTRRNVQVLELALLTIAQNEPVADVVPSSYGTKYTIDGVVTSPTGKSLKVRTIWIIEINESDPRFVTAYPV
jgi:hypothetical protein